MSAAVARRSPLRRPGTGLVLFAMLALASAQAVFAGESGRKQRDGEGAPLRVLFIGNSLTAANDLPALVESIADAEQGPRFDCEVIAFPNYSLEDHWNQGDAVRAIRRGGWSVVVLQQGPSALDESRAFLVAYAERFAEEIERVDSRPALYMVWPSRARSFDFERVSASYTAAAKAVGGLLLPAGDSWRRAWRLDPALALYGPDGFHPSRLGSILAALVIYRRLVALGSAAPTGATPGAQLWAIALDVEPGVASTLDRASVEIRRMISP